MNWVLWTSLAVNWGKLKSENKKKRKRKKKVKESSQHLWFILIFLCHPTTDKMLQMTNRITLSHQGFNPEYTPTKTTESALQVFSLKLLYDYIQCLHWKLAKTSYQGNAVKDFSILAFKKKTWQLKGMLFWLQPSLLFFCVFAYSEASFSRIEGCRPVLSQGDRGWKTGTEHFMKGEWPEV